MHKAREDWEASSKWSWRERKRKILKQKTLDRENRKYLTEKIENLDERENERGKGVLGIEDIAGKKDEQIFSNDNMEWKSKWHFLRPKVQEE